MNEEEEEEQEEQQLLLQEEEEEEGYSELTQGTWRTPSATALPRRRK